MLHFCGVLINTDISIDDQIKQREANERAEQERRKKAEDSFFQKQVHQPIY